MTLVALFIALIFFYSLVSARLDGTVVTAPMVFTTAGMGTFLLLSNVPAWEGGREFFLRVAEVGLVLLLFTDASRTDLRVLNSIRTLSARLLTTGMLLTMLLGALAAVGLFRHLSIWEAAILGVILAPTDAGLGQIIVTSPRVPSRIRQALNVEAGLNDGLAVPFLLFFIALAGTGAVTAHARLSRLVLEQLGYGLVVGFSVGLIGGMLLGLARRRRLMADAFLQLGVVALPLLCALASEAAAASMFIAAFVAGVRPRPSPLRAAQLDGRADASGRHRAHRDTPREGHRAVHGVVRPARAGVDRARRRVPGTRTTSARHQHRPPRGDTHGTAEHLRPRPQRGAGHKLVRSDTGGARPRCPRRPGRTEGARRGQSLKASC